MDNQPNAYNSKETLKRVHKGGSTIQKILNINNSDPNSFSVDEYRNAIINERIKRQQSLQSDNAEMQRRIEFRLNNIKSDHNIIDEYRKTKIAEQANRQQSIQSDNEEVQRWREFMMNNSKMDENSINRREKMKNHLTTERLKQTMSANIRNKQNQIVEMRENIKNNVPVTNMNSEKWNVNTITFENVDETDDTQRIARIIITKRRGALSDEMVHTNL